MPHGSGKPGNTSPYEMFRTLADHNHPKHGYRPGEDVAAWRARALPDVLATLGLPPAAPSERRADLVAEWQDGTVLTQRWLLSVSEDLDAYAYVNRPADLAPGERRPALLCWHGHSAGGKEVIMGNASSPEYRDADLDTHTSYGRRMAEDGFVTFGIDWMGYGDQDDRRKPHHHDVAGNRDWCNLYYLQATMLGMTPLGINLAHGRSLVDHAVTLPFVDADRLGVMGLSGGGTMTLWSALTDERLRAAEIICYSDLFAVFGFRDLNYCGSQITPGLFTLVDLPDLQGLLAPRPLLVDVGAYDECFRLESAMACHERVREIYRAADAGDHLELDLFPGGHGWGGNRSVAFFSRHLGLGR
ncbi:alpha/beta hydrolase family protein [Actinopolymorpha singaporensis]|nr:alpha/beta hydrolase family protein [Actinopolymorpha singaporensis]